MNSTMRALPGVVKGGVTDTVIRVRVTARDVPEITLVDLPGLARVAVEGQPRDTPEMTKRLVRTYIEPANTIILVVVPCNADLATAEALQMAATVDPLGRRTVGVLTKPDLMDPGTELVVRDILRGRVVKLPEHGYFVVRNRGQLAIEAHVSLEASVEDERNFFANHVVFSKLVDASALSDSFGVPALVKYLTQVLVSRVTQEVPVLRARIEERILAESAVLGALGRRPPLGSTGVNDRRAFLLQLTTDFSMSVRETTRGHYDMLSRDSESRGFMAELLGLYRTFDDAVRAHAPNVNSSHYDAAVRDAVHTQHGRESFYGFPSYAIFATLVRDIVGALHPSAERCASLVRNRVVAMSRAASSQRFAQRFPKLRYTVDTITKNLADERHADAVRAVDMFLEMQLQPFTQALIVGAPPPTWKRPTTQHRGGSHPNHEEQENTNNNNNDNNNNAPPAAAPYDSGGGGSQNSGGDDDAAPNEPQRPTAYYSSASSLNGGRSPSSKRMRQTGSTVEADNFRTFAASNAAFQSRGGERDNMPASPPRPARRRQRGAPSLNPQDDESGDTGVHEYAVEFVKSKMERYFEILAARVADLVPMAIDMYLVQKFGHDAALRVANATHAFTDEEIIRLLAEDSDLSKRRADSEDMLRKLVVARETLDDFAATIGALGPF